MKILKYLVGLLLLLVVILLAIGFIVPSITYDSEVFVDKSVKEAYAVMSDESKVSEWLTGITEMKHISGPKGKVGGVTQYTFNDNGMESTIVETITGLVKDEYIEMTFVMEGAMDMDYRVDYGTKDGKTHLKSSTTVKGSGVMMKSMIPFMKGTMQKQEDLNMSKLKKLIDENTTEYFPELDLEMEALEAK